MKLINKTPLHLRCSLAGCPAVYKSEDGKQLVIIGKKNWSVAKKLINNDKVGADEDIITIPTEFFTEVLNQAKK